MATEKKTAAATAATETAKKAVETPAVEKKAPAKKAAAKKPAAKKTTTTKSSAVKSNVYVEYLGAQISSSDLIEKAKKASGVKSPKEINVYVKPEDNKVYYVVDTTAGDFELV